MNRLSAKGIVIGGVVDVALSMVLGVFLTAYVIASRGLLSADASGVQTAVVDAIHQSPALYAIQLLIGLGCSVLGGYVAARLSRESLLLNGVLASWLCVGIGAYSLLSGAAHAAMLVTVLSILVTPFCYLLGAFLRKRNAPGT